MYNKTVLEHFQNPHNFSDMPDPDAVGMGASQVCGDVLTLSLSIKNERIADARFSVRGCGAAIASGSILTDMLKGKSLRDADAITAETLVSSLGGLPAIKMHCPELALDALHAAIRDYALRQERLEKAQ